MDYGKLDSIMHTAGIQSDPAFRDLNVAICPLPDEYSNEHILGLYYPDEMPATFGGVKTVVAARTAILPPDAEPDTVLHELGHAYHDFYHRDISEGLANHYMVEKIRKLAPVMRSPAAYSANGTYVQIVDVTAPTVQAAGQDVHVTVTLKNLYSDLVNFQVVGLFGTTRFIDWQIISLSGNQQGTVTGVFSMPNNATIVRIQVFYTGTDGVLYEDAEQLITVNLQGAYQIPSDYTLESYVLYPDAASYSGDASVGIASFEAILTIIPGVTWLLDRILGVYQAACLSNGAIPLEMRVYTRPDILGSTAYIVQFVAGNAVASRGPAFLGPVALAAIIAIVLGAIILTWKLETIFTTQFNATKTTTYQQPQDVNVKPGGSFSPQNGSVPITNGNTPSTIKKADGITISVPANATVTLAPGDVFVPGAGGAVAHIPGLTTTIESTPQENPLTSTVKWVAIGIIGVVGLIAAIAAFQAFGKREVYPTALRA